MTYKTMSFIHNLLTNKEQETALKLKWTREAFYEAEESFATGAITKSELQTYEDHKERALAEHLEAAAALEEFENQDWR